MTGISELENGGGGASGGGGSASGGGASGGGGSPEPVRAPAGSGQQPAPPQLKQLSDAFWEDEALPVLSDYLRIPCLSPEFDSNWESDGAIAQAAELLCDWASQGEREVSGLTAEVVTETGLTPVILVDVPASPGLEQALPTVLYGHLDKQPPLGAWREGLSPFEPVREGDRLYGRGAGDDGYSLFAALGAIEIGGRARLPHGRCIVIIEASEESGSPHLGPYLQLLSDRLGEAGPGLIVCLDSGATTYDRLWSTTSLRGLAAATVTVKVLTVGVHSGAAGGVVPDSFRLLRRLLDRVEDSETGEVLLESCPSEITEERRTKARALVELIGADALDRFPIVPGAAPNSAPNSAPGSAPNAAPGVAPNAAPARDGDDAVEALLARCFTASLAYVGLDGMPPVADAGNVLRPSTTLKLSLRIPPGADAKAVADELASRLSSDPPTGSTVTLSGVSGERGFAAPATAPWLAGATDAASTEYFGAPAGTMGEGGTIPFLAELLGRYPSAQFLVTGVLGPDSNAHGPNEMLHIPTAKAVTACVAHVLSQVPVGSSGSS